MNISRKAIVGLGLLATTASAIALMASPHGVSSAKAEAPKVAGPARVDDFMLADQDLLGRQLYRMGDDKAVVLVTYASGDKQLHADAKALMALLQQNVANYESAFGEIKLDPRAPVGPVH